MLTWPAVESFVETDRSYLSNDAGGGAGRDDGCTAVTAVLQGQKLIVANVGDSRAVLSRAGHGACCCCTPCPCFRPLSARLQASASCPALAAEPGPVSGWPQAEHLLARGRHWCLASLGLDTHTTLLRMCARRLPAKAQCMCCCSKAPFGGSQAQSPG